MTIKYKKLILIFFLSSIIFSLIIPSATYSQVDEKKQGNSSQSSQTFLEHGLFFNYTDNFKRERYDISIDNIKLDNFNTINLFYSIQGEKSTKEGLEIVFCFPLQNITITIDRAVQQVYVQELTKGFFFPQYYDGSLNITIYIQGRTQTAKNGQLYIDSTSFINKESLVELETTPISLLVFPTEFTLSGSISVKKAFNVTSVILNPLNYSDCVVNLKFSSNDFLSVSRKVYFFTNGILIDSLNFQKDSFNNLSFSVSLPKGIHIFDFVFVIDSSLDIIEVKEILLTADNEEKTQQKDAEESFYIFEWEGKGFNKIIDLSALKPSSLDNVQKLLISIEYSCKGTKISPALYFEILQGQTTLYSGEIKDFVQKDYPQALQVNTYTTQYNRELNIRLYSFTEGKGEITIYNSSSISIAEIPILTHEPFNRTLEEKKEIKTSPISATSVKYYDVFFFESKNVPYNFSLSMLLFTMYNIPLDKVFISFKIGKNNINSKIISNVTEIEINDTFIIQEGYNEVQLDLMFFGEGNVLNLTDLHYILSISKDVSHNSSVDGSIEPIEMIKKPKTIFIGLIVLADCWLILGVIIRLYNKIERSKKDLKRWENEDFVVELEIENKILNVDETEL